MIISPPFLPAQGNAGQLDDQAYVDSAMLDSMHFIHAAGNAPGGSYPLGAAMTWHNGVHLRAPIEAQRRLPVRAIADGTVIFKRETSRLDNPALTYNPFGVEPTWTDTGIVIIRHTTDIGATGNTPSSVTYYSVYMHLSSIEAAVEENKPIWRKDKIGQAGQIYGEDGEMHFEICMNAANLQALVGAARPITWAEPDKVPTADGRTDAVYGSVYVYLPAGTPTSTTAPTRHMRRPKAGASAATDHFEPNTLRAPQWVEISYGRGQGTVRSYRALDSKDGARVGDLIGQALTEPDFEYNLYTEANHRHDSLDSTAQARSSPSGWYELLRFGRNLGPDRLPDDAAHWRRIPTDGGTVWADLNAAGTFKFSDADFPVFKGWQCFDDDTSHDNQRCDSIELKRLIRDPSVPESIRDREALAKRLGKRDVREKLKRTICKFPTEWDRTTIAERYGWLKVDEEFKMDEGEDWGKFKAHCEAVSFGDLPQEYKDAMWHFHPRAFIAHMRQCGWLNATELAQCIPRHALEETKDSTGKKVYPRSNIDWPTALSRASIYFIDLNRSWRKYGISSKPRIAYFLANSIQETIYFSRRSELGGAHTRYAPWYGRGFLQLTWETNYRNYGDFRGWNGQTTSSFRDSLELDNTRAADSAGYYWITCARTKNTLNISTVADNLPTLVSTTLANVCTNYDYRTRTCRTANRTIDYHHSRESERAARAINTGNPNSTGIVNGLIPRNNVFIWAINTLLEMEEINAEKQRPHA